MRFSISMKQIIIFTLVMFCVLSFALLGFLKFTASTAQLATPPKCGGWSIAPSMHPGSTEFLVGVAAVSPTNVWAVGNYVGSTLATVGLIERWNGEGWSVISHPNLGPDSSSEHFNAVAGSSPQDVWVVGNYLYKGAVQRTLIEHWDGTTWNIIASPNTGSTWNDLHAITLLSSRDAWAVGDFSSGDGPLTTLIEHWDGTRWSVVASPNIGSDGNNLLSIAAVSQNDVWAVGRYFGPSHPSAQGLIEHWDGTGWSVVASPNPDRASDYITYEGVTAISPRDMWVVGWYKDGNNITSKALIEHWDGTTWKVVPGPSIQTSSYPLAVTAISSANIWVVGQTKTTTSPKGLIEHWDGVRWSAISDTDATSTTEILHAVARVPGTNTVWAVGEQKSASVTAFSC